ncbi:hypothetical protein J5N97_007552 [Dioscorea zingiberensis]|uniref:Undecaprenyldiphospho-muramoylpentapeptide beta-N-acetylglucosaminyltransferase n=1 Tax=Dioscorea zingiberensis TaxID=325984 RepID=A0A9D5DC35_9LILI|nr:hypothetical protein J5N97_007552 [Dioscorea zingiberensis]
MASTAIASLPSLFATLPRSPKRRTRLLCALAAEPIASTPPSLSVVIAGGGSGGHIFPAIAIADELRADARVVFLGTSSGMERNVIPAAGYEFVPIPKVKLSRPFLSPLNLLLPFQLLRSIVASLRVLREIRPDVVVGTGAYVSAPVLFAAALSGIRLVIQEQNAYPGITNRAIAPYAEKIFLAFNACLKYFPREKCVVCGNPIRLSLNHHASKVDARLHFFPEAGENAKVLLVLGGSTGATALNDAFLKMYHDMLMEHDNRYIIWQTGAEWHNEVESHVKKHPRLLLAPFLHAMNLAYAASDVVVSRAGAMTCTEILNAGKPSILIPSPTAAEDHQTKNAYTMADIAGSKVITEDELDSSKLESAINQVIGDENLMMEMSEKAMRAARPKASSEIAQCILSLVKAPSS